MFYNPLVVGAAHCAQRQVTSRPPPHTHTHPNYKIQFSTVFKLCSYEFSNKEHFIYPLRRISLEDTSNIFYTLPLFYSRSLHGGIGA